jgi:large subunit ribosomal protein L17
MRHGKRFNHLGRTSSHRKATLSNLASSLFLHKRINTTLAKAKALRQFVEPLITKAKNDTTHTRRVVFSYLQNKESVKALYNEVVDRIGERPGGYTRIIKLGSRLGDNAEMAMIELVDFNDLLIEETKTKKAKTRRSRRGGKKTADTPVSGEDDSKKTKKKEEKSKDAEQLAGKAEEKTGDDSKATPVEDAKHDSPGSDEEPTGQKTQETSSKVKEQEEDQKEELKAKAPEEKKETDENSEAGEEDEEEKEKKE